MQSKPSTALGQRLFAPWKTALPIKRTLLGYIHVMPRLQSFNCTRKRGFVNRSIHQFPLLKVCRLFARHLCPYAVDHLGG